MRSKGQSKQAKAADGKYRIGYTIAGESRQRRYSELERSRAHRKKHRRNGVAIAVVTVVLLAVAAVFAVMSLRLAEQREAERLAEMEAELTPTVAIIDENASEAVSARVTEFVAHLEADVKEYGLKVERVVLPFQKAREIHVYLEGRTEYYKMTIDRSSAVQAEDMAEMVKYLNGRGVVCEYVDLRVKGKAYYK